MATATTRRRGGTTKKASPKVEPEIEEIDDLEEDEVEEIDEEPEPPKKKAAVKKTPAAKKKQKEEEPAFEDDDLEDGDEDEKPAKKSSKAATEVIRGTQWLAAHVNRILGTEHKAYDLRVLLRKLAKNGTLDREVGSDRSRYDFEGPKDPVVLLVLKMLKSGELEKQRKEKLDKLKEGRTKNKSKVVDDDEVGDDLDEDVDELDEDE